MIITRTVPVLLCTEIISMRNEELVDVWRVGGIWKGSLFINLTYFCVSGYLYTTVLGCDSGRVGGAKNAIGSFRRARRSMRRTLPCEHCIGV